MKHRISILTKGSAGIGFGIGSGSNASVNTPRCCMQMNMPKCLPFSSCSNAYNNSKPNGNRIHDVNRYSRIINRTETSNGIYTRNYILCTLNNNSNCISMRERGTSIIISNTNRKFSTSTAHHTNTNTNTNTNTSTSTSIKSSSRFVVFIKRIAGILILGYVTCTGK